ncbi:MAG: DNA primase [Bacilli bacterium]|nr:DNA primase [Bacilli bacterium]
MAFISESELNDIKNSINIVEVINKYIPLTEKGKNYFGVCPFHDDHSPSMSVSKDKQIYKCFSCGASGNVFTFLQNYNNITFQEAVMMAADYAGIKINNTFKKEPSKFSKEHELMNLSNMYYENLINSSFGISAVNYLKERGFSKDVIKEFNIGVSPDTNDGLIKLINSKKLDLNMALNIGLINKGDYGYYDVFTKRIMIPIKDEFGQTIGYSARIYNTDSQNRYMNSKENYLFKKGNILFNYDKAKQDIKKSKEIIIVEGNLDAIRLYDAGIKNVIALMGTALTDYQINLLKKLKCKVILMLDNDDAGLNATYNIGKTLFNENFNVGVVRLSDYKDPDLYLLNNGIEKLNNLITNNINFIDFEMYYLKKDLNLNKTEELRDYIKKVITSLKNSNDELLIDLTLTKISEDYHVDKELLKNEFEAIKNKSKNEGKIVQEPIKFNKTKYDNLVINILYYMMNDYKYVKGFKNKLGYIKTKVYRDISNDIISYADLNKQINLSDFITYINLNNYNVEEINNIINACKYEEFSDEFFDSCIKNINKETINEEIKELKVKLKNELDENKKMEILEKITDLKKGSV